MWEKLLRKPNIPQSFYLSRYKIMESLKDRFSQLVDEKHQAHFTLPDTQDKRESAGCLISSYCHYDINSVAVACLAAMEDANMHEEYAHLSEYLTNKGYNLEKVIGYDGSDAG